MSKQLKYAEELINVFDNDNLREWCLKLNCGRDELITAVLNAGKHPSQVRSFLKKKNPK
jgi:hypothetical protein